MTFARNVNNGEVVLLEMANWVEDLEERATAMNAILAVNPQTGDTSVHNGPIYSREFAPAVHSKESIATTANHTADQLHTILEKNGVDSDKAQALNDEVTATLKSMEDRRAKVEALARRIVDLQKAKTDNTLAMQAYGQHLARTYENIHQRFSQAQERLDSLSAVVGQYLSNAASQEVSKDNYMSDIDSQLDAKNKLYGRLTGSNSVMFNIQKADIHALVITARGLNTLLDKVATNNNFAVDKYLSVK